MMRQELKNKIVLALKESDLTVESAYIFGSLARGTFNQQSDVDIAILCPSITPQQKLQLWENLVLVSGRSVDLVELSTAGSVITHEAINGERVIGSDETHAKILTRMLIENADFGVLRARILNQRRNNWLAS